MTRQEIEQKMAALAREYHDTHDPGIPEEIFELARQLRSNDGRGLRSGPLFSCAEITGGDISISPKRWLIDVLIFHCSNCNETINSADDESTDQIFARLEEHVTKCLLATFTFDGTTDIARQRVGAWRAVIERERLVGRLRLH